jgi:hypothetical protein
MWHRQATNSLVIVLSSIPLNFMRRLAGEPSTAVLPQTNLEGLIGIVGGAVLLTALWHAISVVRHVSQHSRNQWASVHAIGACSHLHALILDVPVCIRW